MLGKRLLGLLLLLVCGCYQRIFPIRAVETKDGIAFELPEVAEGMSRARRYELLDLSVGKRACASDCTDWDLARVPGPGGVHLTAARIAYGEHVPGTVVRTPARRLTPGLYTVGATVQEYGSDAALIRSLTTLGDFEVYQDGSGKLRARSHDRSASQGGCQ